MRTLRRGAPGLAAARLATLGFFLPAFLIAMMISSKGHDAAWQRVHVLLRRRSKIDCLPPPYGRNSVRPQCGLRCPRVFGRGTGYVCFPFRSAEDNRRDGGA